MNLIIDVGNTSVKLAVFSKNKLFRKVTVPSNQLVKEVKSLKTKHKNISNGIISTVGNSKAKDVRKSLREINIIELNYNTNLPFKNLYKSPKTLGVDRMALVAAASLKHTGKNTLIIDAGTCITYDFISKKNEYLGGAISPGLVMRYKSMNNLTANLPLLRLKAPKQHIGFDTKSSMHSGVVNGVLYEIDGAIEQYAANYKDLTVILTGGDAKFLSKRLKNTIFANSNFLLEGLNYILEFNKS